MELARDSVATHPSPFLISSLRGTDPRDLDWSPQTLGFSGMNSWVPSAQCLAEVFSPGEKDEMSMGVGERVAQINYRLVYHCATRAIQRIRMVSTGTELSNARELGEVQRAVARELLNRLDRMSPELIHDAIDDAINGRPARW